MRVNRSPDPTGEQLQRLIPLLRTMVEQTLGYGEARKWGIVWDFMSLPQRGRTSGYNADADDRTPCEIVATRTRAACVRAAPLADSARVCA